MIISGRRGVGIGRRPTIHGGIVSPAGVKPNTASAAAGGNSTPDDHFTASPYVVTPRGRRLVISPRPTRPRGVAAVAPANTHIAPATVENNPAPDDHFSASPYCRPDSGIRRVGNAGRRPTVRVGIISAA